MELLFIEISMLVLFMLLSAFFSASETALFSLKKSDIHRFSMTRDKRELGIYALMQSPQKILITLLTGNLFVNLAASELSTYMLLQVWEHYGHFISIAIVTPIIIVVCENTPKLISVNFNVAMSRRLYPLISGFHRLFFPIRILLVGITNLLVRLFGLQFNHASITEDELGHAVNIGQRDGVIGPGEGFIIQNVIRFSKKDASNVMFPRNNAVFIPKNATIEESMRTFVESGVIRAPIYENDYDTIIGFIDSRELLSYYYGFKKTKNINRFIHPISFFPSTRNLNDLLKDFLKNRIQIAIIVDEYGGTAGVVTLNTILMELLGKETTKWEVDYKPEIMKMNDDIAVISGSMQIEDFNFLFNEYIYSDESDSIGGYIMERLSSLPKRGQEISTGRYILRVRFIKKNKIETVEVIRLPQEDAFYD